LNYRYDEAVKETGIIWHGALLYHFDQKLHFKKMEFILKLYSRFEIRFGEQAANIAKTTNTKSNK